MTQEEKNQIIDMTLSAIGRINHPRFFRSERGYQGELYCRLREEFLSQNLLDERMLEPEYQKRPTDHLTQQRPDIIYHIPAPAEGEVFINNYTVWALKLRADHPDVISDFEKLYEMISLLQYPLAVFLNIDSDSHYLHDCIPDYRNRIVAFTTMRNEAEGKLVICKAYYDRNDLQEEFYSVDW
ncbi:hypothetical protein [Desulfomonile tiedjei]|uniref:Uncharacterized protein n=1 Tax=Desulfomonile tiedjei (strain ATCC 49306 / DSM 6799 / DCB-1) TaxID=706587 RepID=I4C196_DESTA|nr:hypothetical protein [Desulfomonile tiedjei]AFM23337.1 hypothetical protein Desti_0609 [Desulfomonile tiedjei DSM 6799]